MIEQLIAECAWDSGRYILFSQNVFSPLIYYSHLTPVLVSLIFGIYIYFSNKKSLLNKVLLFITIILSLWLLLDLVLWATDSRRIVMFAWSIVNMIEPIIYAGFVYFTMTFVSGRDISPKMKFFLVLPLIPTILAAGTHWNVTGFNLTDCDREVIEGPMAFYNYLIEIGYVLWIVALGFLAAVRSKSPSQRNQSLVVVISVLTLLLGFAAGNIVGSFSEDWAIGQYGLFVIPVAIGTLTYFVAQFRFFEKSQLMLAQILVTGIWLAVGSILFIQSIQIARWIVGVTLVSLAVLGFLLVRSFGREIEQRKQIEIQKRKIETTAKQLEETNQQLSEFMSLATHEIRNPATVIKGISSLAMEGDFGKLAPAALDAFQKMFVRANDIIHLGNQYLDKSKLELNQLVYTFEDFSMGSVIETLVSEFQPAALQRTVSLVADIDKSQDSTVCADKGKIKEVLGNLIDNAVKYTPPKGLATISILKSASTVTVKVTDNGPGIPAETIPRLFKKFSRADAQKANLLGTGLGLYLSKTFVDAHHGRIWVESEGPNKGSTFFVELPIKQDQKEVAPVPASSPIA